MLTLSSSPPSALDPCRPPGQSSSQSSPSPHRSSSLPCCAAARPQSPRQRNELAAAPRARSAARRRSTNSWMQPGCAPILAAASAARRASPAARGADGVREWHHTLPAPTLQGAIRGIRRDTRRHALPKAHMSWLATSLDHLTAPWKRCATHKIRLRGKPLYHVRSVAWIFSPHTPHPA